MIQYSGKKIAAGVIFLILLCSTIFFFYQYGQARDLLNNPQKKTAEDLKKTITEIGKLMILPKEQATLATVTDVSKLAGQPFFINAQNGDKIIIYTQSKEAILYRPALNKIIAVSPISLGSPESSPGGQLNIIKTEVGPIPSSVENKLKVGIYNGTKISGLASKKKDLVLSKVNNIEVTDLGNSKSDYTENLVIDLKSVNNSTAQQLAQIISGKITSLPKGETAPTGAQLLLIIGKE